MRLTSLSALLLLLITGACASHPSETPGPTARTPVPEGINARFLDPLLDPDSFARRWEVESREVVRGLDHVLAACQIEPGDRIADVGAGTGLYLGPFSRAVGRRGAVMALDISPRFYDHLRRRVRNEDLPNVQVVLSEERSTTLPANCVDTVFVCDTYHHFEYHQDMLASIRKALVPGGTLIVVDFERIPGQSRPWLLEHVRAGKQTVLAEIERAGFELELEVEVPEFRENYLLRFRRGEDRVPFQRVRPIN